MRRLLHACLVSNGALHPCFQTHAQIAVRTLKASVTDRSQRETSRGALFCGSCPNPRRTQGIGNDRACQCHLPKYRPAVLNLSVLKRDARLVSAGRPVPPLLRSLRGAFGAAKQEGVVSREGMPTGPRCARAEWGCDCHAGEEQTGHQQSRAAWRCVAPRGPASRCGGRCEPLQCRQPSGRARW